MDNSFVLKGDICYSETPTRLACQPNSYLICENGVARGGSSRNFRKNTAGFPCGIVPASLSFPVSSTCICTPRSMPSAASEWTWNFSTG